jgi:hypothetical protein
MTENVLTVRDLQKVYGDTVTRGRTDDRLRGAISETVLLRGGCLAVHSIILACSGLI